MRILHIATRLTPGGAPRNIIATIEWEIQNGHTVHLAIGAGESPPLPRGAIVGRIQSLKREVGPVADLRAFLELQRYIRKGQFDLVHTHYSKAGIIGRSAARRHCRAVVHTIHMASFGPGYSLGASLLFRTAERHCAPFTDYFVAVGQDLKRKYLASGIGHSNQYWVIPSPLGVDQFERARNISTAAVQRARAHFGIPQGTKAVVAAGLLERRKRFDLIIRTLAPLLRSGSVDLLIAGEGPERERLESMAERLGVSAHVRLLGYVENLPDLFACSSVLVHASRVEGLPQVVVQALAAGLPVVASNVEGLADLPRGSVKIVDKSGGGILNACIETLASPKKGSVPLDLLKGWNTDQIEAKQLSFHEAISELIDRRGGPS